MSIRLACFAAAVCPCKLLRTRAHRVPPDPLDLWLSPSRAVRLNLPQCFADAFDLDNSISLVKSLALLGFLAMLDRASPSRLARLDFLRH